jgi:hypothetical protein
VPKPGDVASVALYRPEREAAIAQLNLVGWRQTSAEVVSVSCEPNDTRAI